MKKVKSVKLNAVHTAITKKQKAFVVSAAKKLKVSQAEIIRRAIADAMGTNASTAE